MTRSVSATSRSIIDTLRTLFIWLVSLGLGWEKFNWLQLLGIDTRLQANGRICNSCLGDVYTFATGIDVDYFA